MEKRTCQRCGLPNYSSDSSNVWHCHTCGGVILKYYKKLIIKQIIKDGKIVGYVGKNF